MGWENGPITWKELESKLSDRRPRGRQAPRGRPEGADGSDAPAWADKRSDYQAPPLIRHTSSTPHAELHCHSNFSFLDGASSPEALVEEAVRLDLEALAITDHDRSYGVVRFAEAARTHGLPTVFDSELTIGAPRPPKPNTATVPQPDPGGKHLLVLARDNTGYAALARVISEAQLAGDKGAPRLAMEDFDRWLEPNTN